MGCVSGEDDKFNISRMSLITKVRSRELSKQLKDYYLMKENNKETISGRSLHLKEYYIYYDIKEEEYKVSNIDPETLTISHVLIGKMSWEQVMRDTKRNNIRVGEDYLYDWVRSRVSEGKVKLYTAPNPNMRRLRVSFNGEEVDYPNGVIKLSVSEDRPTGLIHASLID